MQSKPQSIYELFDHKRRYLVPLFQRQYVWRQDIQWEPLWEDIRGKAIDHLEQSSSNKVSPHFLGALVTNEIQVFGNSVRAYTIIDGQQRLTTFQIFLAAFRDVARNHEAERFAEETERYLFNTGLMDDPEIERFKVFPTRADQRQFVHVLNCGGPSALEEKYPPVYVKRKLQPRPKMVEAYLFFTDAIEKYLAEHSEFNTHTEDLVEALYQALRKDLQVVSIELESEDDPQLIFETLNARGEPLLASDLLRNFLFRRAEQSGEDQNELYDSHWINFENEFWREEIKQGRLSRARLDIFMQHFLALKRGSDANVLHLYKEYKDWITTNHPYLSIREELLDLLHYAKAFRELVSPQLSTTLGKFAQRLSDLDLRTIYPLIMFLICDAGVSESEKDGIFTDLESYLVRRAVCGKTTKNYNKMFLQVLREVQQQNVTRNAIRRILLSFSGDAGVFPDDREFRRAWLRIPVYEKLKPARVASLLRSVELAMHNKFGEGITIGAPLSIEHVMPQDWESNWPLDENYFDDVYDMFEPGTEPELVRAALVETFGNLTLLTQPLNSSISNAAYDIKRPEITKQSLLKLNSYFQDVISWDEQAIKNRGEDLFEVALRLWPYPDV